MSTTDSSSRIILIRNSSLLPNKIHSSKIPKSRQALMTYYGAQNEAYMSRSAEKWVRGLCFNELGVCD